MLCHMGIALVSYTSELLERAFQNEKAFLQISE